MTDDLKELRQRAEDAEGEVKLLRAAADPRNVDTVRSLVQSVTRLVGLERDDARERAERAEAAIGLVRRMAQVWIDIRPTHPTATREGDAMAYAGRQIIAALELPRRPQPPEASTPST